MTRPNLKKVKDLFSPDEKGCSDWKTIQEVIDAGLNWSENGNVRRARLKTPIPPPSKHERLAMMTTSP